MRNRGGVIMHKMTKGNKSRAFKWRFRMKV